MGSLKTESETDVVRITIRGYPRGVSLRALAQRGVDGSRFEGSFETTDLRVLARKVAEAKVPLETELAETAALDGLAAALGKDADVQKALKEMTEKVAAAAADKEKPEKNKAAAEAVNAARAAIEKFEKSYAEAPANAGKPAVTAAVTSAIGQLPDGLDPAKASLEAIQKVQAKLKEHQATLEKRALQQRGTQKSASDLRDDLDRRLARLCRIAKGLLPVVDEDVLIARTSPGVAAPGVYVIEYDYDAGFQRAPPRDLADTDRVYVRVRRVRPNEAVAIAINDKGVVQHAVSLVGYVHKDNPAPAEPSKDPVAHAGGLRLGINDLRPDDPDIQASSTQILALPRFDGARRYDFVLCGLTDRAGACPPGETVGKSRVIARNTLVVHSKRRLGVRAGVGFTGTFGEVRSLEDVPGSTLKYVRQQPVTLDAAVPLLLTYYFIPRDAVDMPRHFTMGLVAGPDMVATFQAKPRLYLGLALDFWGFGLTFGNLVEQRDTINAAAGSYLASAPTVKRWYGGAFLTLTTDLDIFEAVLRNYILSTPAPTVGNGGK